MVSYTQADLDAVKAALLTGALEVRIGDRTVKYRNQAELIELMKMIALHVDGVPSESPNVIQATFSKGSE